MPKEENYEVVHAFISGSKDVVKWGYWHASMVIWKWSQAPAGVIVRGLKDLNFVVKTVNGEGRTSEAAIEAAKKRVPQGAFDIAVQIIQKGKDGTLEVEGYSKDEGEQEAREKIPKDAVLEGFLGLRKKLGSWKAYWSLPFEASISFKQGVEFAVNIKYGTRDNALLLMYKGRKNELISDEIQAIIGLDVNRASFTKLICARGRNEIEQLLRLLYDRMLMSSQISFATGDEIPSGFKLEYLPPPTELHPSKWTKLGDTIEEISPPEFEVPKVPEENPAVAWSRYANQLRCAYCAKLNVALEWPPQGDDVPFYFQTMERTEKVPGAYRIKVHCSFCNKNWFVVWDEDPR
jgi:hypothetical protein